MKKWFGFFIIFALVMLSFMVFGSKNAQAEEVKKGLVYFKMGENSIISSSALNAKINFGFGANLRLLEKAPLYQTFYDNL